ncbi:MAG: inorganic phosphate transporter [Betaproteobacteria bacterium]|nr:inorganic phosphate transporter [Betaproteobacteria bacterium]
MKFKHIDNLEKATRKGKLESLRMGICFTFLLGVMLYTNSLGLDVENGLLLAIAAVIGGYMAINIGANDVANNIGPSVGSHAITMGGALMIAAIFEAAGALIAGGEVVATIKDGIINPVGIADTRVFVWLMMAALLASALWLNIATAVGAPVSTTHSIVGAVLGAGVAAAGWEAVNWHTISGIGISWIISPVLGGIVAAGLLYFIKRYITYQTDMLTAAVKTVPFLVALMAWTFTTYLMLKGLNKVWPVSVEFSLIAGFIVSLVVFLLLRPFLKQRMARYENSKEGVNQFFTIPLIFSAALLSFAHGSNDVANAVGPLAAITHALVGNTELTDKVDIPFWVMIIGALGISLGLALFGPKLIRTVGSEITELDKTRAYCIAMASALTVIIASQLGLPVSSTHIAVGGVFGVGFLREYLKANYARMEDEIRAHHSEDDLVAINVFLASFKSAPLEQKGMMLKELKMQARLKLDPANFSKPERKGMKKFYRRELVKRSLLKRIIAAWLITVPASALMATGIFYLLLNIVG